MRTCQFDLNKKVCKMQLFILTVFKIICIIGLRSDQERKVSMSFGDRLKESRCSFGFTQQQLAELIGVAKSTYNGYEKGAREPDLFKLKRLIEVLQVDSSWLLGVDELETTKDSPTPAEADTGDERLDSIIENYNQLNDAGKDDLAKHAEHLTYIPEYKKCDSVQEPQVG